MAGTDNSEHEDFSTIMGAILKMMREARSLTQSQLSELLEQECGLTCSVPQVSRYESGTCSAPFEYIIHACKVTKFHPVTFMLCFIKNDFNWWQASITLNSGMYFDDVLTGNFEKYGDRLLRLTPNDMELMGSLVRTMLDGRLGDTLPQRPELEISLPQKTPLQTKRG